MRSRQKAAARSHCGGQGYEAISFDGEHRIVNGALIKRCEYYHSISNETPLTEASVTHGQGESERILTDAAKSVIQQGIRNGEFDNRSTELEPPFMGPSVDPDRYSWVSVKPCSLKL